MERDNLHGMKNINDSDMKPQGAIIPINSVLSIENTKQ